MVKNIIEGAETIQELWRRRAQIRDTVNQLQREDDAIVSILNDKLGLDLQNDSVQHFQVGDLKLKATPKIYRKVDSERARALMEEDPDARIYAGIFKEKLELVGSKWKALEPREQAIFAGCITETSGKPQYQEEK